MTTSPGPPISAVGCFGTEGFNCVPQALHIASHIQVAAAPGEILVSSTVKDLAVGSTIRFTDRGETSLKGVPEPWRLFAVAD